MPKPADRKIFTWPLLSILLCFSAAGVIRSCQDSTPRCQCAEMGHGR